MLLRAQWSWPAYCKSLVDPLAFNEFTMLVMVRGVNWAASPVTARSVLPKVAALKPPVALVNVATMLRP